MSQSKPHSSTAALLERLGRLMRAREHEAGLNPAQWDALRYLARCNRFSNTPTATTAYLFATKGTVSQSLNALVRKGLVEKKPRPEEGRSVALFLTNAGRTALRKDPSRRMEQRLSHLDPEAALTLDASLRQILGQELAAQNFASFGMCRSCRHFQARHNLRNIRFPHHCALLDAPLAEADADKICAEHEAPPTE